MKKVISVFLIAFLTISMTGCVKNHPQDTVESYLNAIKSGELGNLDEYLLEGKEKNEEYEFILKDEFEQAMINAYSKLEYEILSTEIEGDNAKVEAKIKSPDLGSAMEDTIMEVIPKLLEDAFNEAFNENAEDNFDEEATQKEIEETFTNKINKDKLPMVENTVKIKLVKKDKEWLIDLDKEFSNALSGDLEKSLDGLDNIE